VGCSLLTPIRIRGSGIARRLHPRSKPARALAAETLNLESRRHGLVNQAHRLTPAEIDLMWAAFWSGVSSALISSSGLPASLASLTSSSLSNFPEALLHPLRRRLRLSHQDVASGLGLFRGQVQAGRPPAPPANTTLRWGNTARNSSRIVKNCLLTPPAKSGKLGPK
jgi:hypothetical protein